MLGMRPHWAYLDPLIRRPLRVVVPAALGLVAGLALALGLSPRYRAKVLLAVELTPGAKAVSASTATTMLHRRLPAIRQQLQDGARVERVRGAVDIRVLGADRVELECVDEDPSGAAAGANRLAALLVERTEAQWTGQPPTNVEGLEMQLAQAGRALEANRQALDRLRRSGIAGSAEPVADVVALQRLAADLAALILQLRGAQRELDGLRGAPRDGTVPPDDPELARLRQELTTLRARYTEQHPDVEALLRRLAERQAAVARAETTSAPAEASPQVRRAEADIELLSARKAQLESEMARLRDPARDTQTAGSDRQISALEHERVSLQEDHLALLRAMAHARLAAAQPRSSPTEHFRVINPASPSKRPFFPDRRLYSLLGFLSGLTAGFLAALLAEVRDQSVKNAEDLMELLHLPLLAEIPFVRRSFRW